jgi:excisionase family DNA binding protein
MTVDLDGQLDLMTVPEVARLLRLSDAAVYALCRSGQLPHHRLGQGKSAIRINKADVVAYLQGSKRGATPASSPLSSTTNTKRQLPSAGGFKHLHVDQLLGGQPPADGPSSDRGARNAL